MSLITVILGALIREENEISMLSEKDVTALIN